MGRCRLPVAPRGSQTASPGGRPADPPTSYDPETIYAYIDGQAEVYLAYGMRRCVSRRFRGPEGEADLVADAFELASPEDAFGVFTHDRDGEPAEVGTDSLVRFGWLSYWKGPYFVSIVAEKDTERSRQAVLDLGRAIAAQLPQTGTRPAIAADLPADRLEPRSVRFLRHPQILNTHVFVSDENVLGLSADTAAALGTYRADEAIAHVLLVDYPDATRATAAADAFRKALLRGARGDDPVELETRGLFAVRALDRRVVAVLGATTAALARDLLAVASTPRGAKP